MHNIYTLSLHCTFRLNCEEPYELMIWFQILGMNLCSLCKMDRMLKVRVRNRWRFTGLSELGFHGLEAAMVG